MQCPQTERQTERCFFLNAIETLCAYSSQANEQFHTFEVDIGAILLSLCIVKCQRICYLPHLFSIRFLPAFSFSFLFSASVIC